MSDADPLPSFDCPRCGRTATAEHYGPCATCVIQLRASGGDARTVERAAYEPKMNVVPNQVAIKE